MSDLLNQNYSGATTTVNSSSEGRLKVNVSKKKKLRSILRKQYKK